jgi:hypothetical protein
MKILMGMMMLVAGAAHAEKIVIEKVDVIQGARALLLQMPISTRSDVNGVCLLLGYDSGIDGTKVPFMQTIEQPGKRTRWSIQSGIQIDIAPKADALVVDADGKIVRQVYSKQLSEVKCIKKVSEPTSGAVL